MAFAERTLGIVFKSPVYKEHYSSYKTEPVVTAFNGAPAYPTGATITTGEDRKVEKTVE